LPLDKAPYVSHDLPNLRFLEYRAPRGHLSRPSDTGAALGDDLDKILIGVFVHLDSGVICGFDRQRLGGRSIALPGKAVASGTIAWYMLFPSASS
jgi:hypothetical protein